MKIILLLRTFSLYSEKSLKICTSVRHSIEWSIAKSFLQALVAMTAIIKQALAQFFGRNWSKMATTREPAIPAEDEREILSKGIPGIDSAIAKQPLLGSYLPVDPVNRYTFKKWDLGDWGRHNENKYFQANRDRDRAIT